MWPKPTLPRPQRNELQPRVGCNRTWSAPVNRHPANHEPSQSCLVAISPEKPAGEISGLRFRSVVSNQYQDTQCSPAPLSGSKHRAAPAATFLEIHCCADAVCNFWPFKRLSKHRLGTPSVPPPVETEVKLELPSSEVMRLNKLVPPRRMKPAKQVTQVSLYFDTDEFALRKNGVMFRVRRTGRNYVQTIKTTGRGLLDRNEWETGLTDEKPDFGAMRHTALEPLLTKLRRRLRPVFETRVRRTTYPLEVGGSKVEVALDRGEVATGDRSKSLCEIEIELKAGDKAELFKLARTIARATSAELAVKSKAQRGYELRDGTDNSAAKAERVVLAPDTATRDAFRLIAASCLKQIVANKSALLAGNPEGVHQTRVGLRRLRAAISLFSDILEVSETSAIKSELKWLTEELGPAREFEVFLKRVLEPARRQHTRLLGMRRLTHDLAEQRRSSEERARNAVMAERFRHLLLTLATWLETGDWRCPQA